MPRELRFRSQARACAIILLSVLALTSASACATHAAQPATQPTPACTKPDAQTPAGHGAYSVVHGWPALSEGYVLGQVSGVAIDSRGDVLVFHRADHPWLAAPDTVVITQPTLLRLDPTTGQIVWSFGANQFVVPHGLRIDAHDHMWVTDVGTHQVFELDKQGAVLRSFGTAGQPGTDATHFNQPTDVAVAADGSIYVSDGYGNSRVVQYAADGSYVRSWGTPGNGPGQFNIPHSIALDAKGRVYVADRGNARIQRFDPSGKFIDQWQSTELGRPWAVTIARDGSVFVVDGGDENPVPPDRGRLLRLDQAGKILEKWSSFGNYDGQLYWGHALAVADNGDVFVGDVHYGMRVQKFTRTP
ncbi:MAG TPA: 6-bladed beta-propeller [Polyangiales bacterium]